MSSIPIGMERAQISANCGGISGNVGCIGMVTDNTTPVQNVNKILIVGSVVSCPGPGIAQITTNRAPLRRPISGCIA